MTDPVPFFLADQEYDPEIPVTDLHEHPKNYNHGAVEAIAESLDYHGFYGAVIVQKSTGLILAGNHRYRIAVSKGAKTIPGFRLDVSDEEAERILAVDNGTTHLATFDEAALVALLKPMQSAPEGLRGTGWTDKRLSEMARRQEAVMSGDETSGDDGKPKAKPAYSCTFHFDEDSDAERFFDLIGEERPAARSMWWPK